MSSIRIGAEGDSHYSNLKRKHPDRENRLVCFLDWGGGALLERHHCLADDSVRFSDLGEELLGEFLGLDNSEKESPGDCIQTDTGGGGE